MLPQHQKNLQRFLIPAFEKTSFKDDAMFRIILAVLLIAACYKWGDWKNWKEYYPTCLYYIIGDFSYNILFHDHLLWEYGKLYTHTFSDYFDAFFVAPPTIILFLTHFPVKPIIKLLYTLCWVCVYTFIEYLSRTFGYIKYDYGWNIIWSFGVFCVLFPLLRLHYKKPLLAWPISLGFALLTLYIFHVPLSSV
jgi:hypothetical protein